MKATLPTIYHLLILMLITSETIAHGPIQTEPLAIDISTFPPIEQDIAALANYGNAARAAGTRLVERGYDALNELHAALLDPSATYPQKLQIITVLGEIGEAGSVEHILHIAEESNKNRYLYQNTLLALTKFEQTETITEFVDEQLVNTSEDPLILRSSLAYYAKQPTAEAAKWVDTYGAADASLEVRYAALYLGGTLGMKSVQDDIIDLLQNKQSNAREYYLLLGLADITGPEAFETITSKLTLDPNNLMKAKQYNQFQNSDKSEKDALAERFLTKGDTMLKHAATSHLIADKNAAGLAEQWNRGNPFVRSSLRRTGLEVEQSEHGPVIVEHDKHGRRIAAWWYGVIGLVFFACAILWHRHTLNKNP